MKVFIRKLQLKDALISWKWRNDPEIWQSTGRKWNNNVTQEIEEDWIRRALQSKDSHRFAICAGDNGKYIGNVQFTDITKDDAIFHIFIGAKEFWGKGVGTKATELALKYGFEKLGLKKIYLRVQKDNHPALRIYKNMDFRVVEECDSMLKMVLESNERK